MSAEEVFVVLALAALATAKGGHDSTRRRRFAPETALFVPYCCTVVALKMVGGFVLCRPHLCGSVSILMYFDFM